jgi:hypothetical protein
MVRENITSEFVKPAMATDARQYHQLIGFHQYQGEVSQWAKETFPHATGVSFATHLLYEAVELLIAELLTTEESESFFPDLPSNGIREMIRNNVIHAASYSVDKQLRKAIDPEQQNPVEESADVALLLLAYCGHKGISLAGAMTQKFAVNQTRQFGERNAQGVSEHVE